MAFFLLIPLALFFLKLQDMCSSHVVSSSQEMRANLPTLLMIQKDIEQLQREANCREDINA
jgi:hypothetical protein